MAQFLMIIVPTWICIYINHVSENMQYVIVMDKGL